MEFELHAKFFASSPRTHSYFLLGKEGNGGTSNELQAAIRHFGSRVGGGGGGQGMRRGHAVEQTQIVKERLRDFAFCSQTTKCTIFMLCKKAAL